MGKAANTCRTCRYSAPSLPVPNCDDQLLECHRHAPQALSGGGDDPTRGCWWPKMWPDDWCGEFQYIPADRVMGKVE